MCGRYQHMDRKTTISALEWWLNYNQQRSCTEMDGNLRAAIECAVVHLKRDAPEERQGHWVEENSNPKGQGWLCSVCVQKAYQPRSGGQKKMCTYKYCPHCGAVMEGDGASHEEHKN